jgi:hypothetical protein
VSGDYNDVITLQATLVDSGVSPSAPIVGEAVSFTVGTGAPAVACSAATDHTGTASCRLVLTQLPAAYDITLSFQGDSNYEPSTAHSPFSVSKDDTAVSYSGVSSQDYHDAATVSARLFDQTDSTPIVGKSLSFSLGTGANPPTCTGQTDATGAASCSLSPNQPVGAYMLSATFAGDGFYQAKRSERSVRGIERRDDPPDHVVTSAGSWRRSGERQTPRRWPGANYWADRHFQRGRRQSDRHHG